MYQVGLLWSGAAYAELSRFHAELRQQAMASHGQSGSDEANQRR